MHYFTSRISNFRKAAATLGKWNRMHLGDRRTDGIRRAAIQFSMVRQETEFTRATTGLVTSPEPSAAGPVAGTK